MALQRKSDLFAKKVLRSVTVSCAGTVGWARHISFFEMCFTPMRQSRCDWVACLLACLLVTAIYTGLLVTAISQSPFACNAAARKQGSEAATAKARQQRQQKGRNKPGARQEQARSKAGARPTILQQDFPHENPTMLGKVLRKDEPNLVLGTETRFQTRPKRGSNVVPKQPKPPVAQADRFCL